jgi:glucokinase
MSDAKLAIGIDFGGTSVKVALIQGSTIVAHGEPVPTQQYAGPHALLEALGERILNLSKTASAKGESAPPIGIGLPGLVDSVNGVVHELTNVPGWVEVPLRAILSERFNCAVILENDANAMAYGEYRYGAAKQGRNVICITLGTGVGGGLILDGRLYRGSQLAAGEIGHLSIDYRGVPSPFGNFGGLETYVGNQRIIERAQSAYSQSGNTAPNPLTPRSLAEAANAGCAVAKEIWDEVGTQIGAGLASSVWLLNPDTIVIGGGVAAAGPLVFDPIIRTIRSRTAPVVHQSLAIVPAELGNDAGMIGCAALALEASR